MDDSSLNKIRKTAIIIGIILILIPIGGLEFDEYLKMPSLGMSLRIKRPNVIPVVLIIFSLFFTLKYWYYGMLLGNSPRVVRKNLLTGKLADGSNLAENKKEFNEKVRKDLCKYFPLLPFQKNIELETVTVSKNEYNFKFKPSIISSFLGFFQDIDYYFPVIINIAGYILYSLYFFE